MSCKIPSEGCDGFTGSGKVLDDCGVCDGDNSTCLDECGIPNGDNICLKVFGGINDEHGNSIQQTNDGGYIILGSTSSYGNGNYDIWLIKTDADGNQEWDQTFGGQEDDYGKSIDLTNDGGYIITGYTKSYGNGSNDFWLIKTDLNGNEEWDETFGNYGSDIAYEGYETLDGGYIIIGYSQSYGNNGSTLVIKTDSDGDDEWIKSYDGNGTSIQQTEDGGYVISGYKRIYDNSCQGMIKDNFWLLKINLEGNQEWYKTYGSCYVEYAHSVQQTIDGGYIVLGRAYIEGGANIWLIKTDIDGNEEWNKIFGEFSSWDFGNSIQATIDGGYILTGILNYTSGSNPFLIKTDNYGNQQWEQSFGGIENDYGNFVQQLTDGGYVIIGTTNSYSSGGSDIWLIKTDSQGSLVF